MTGLQMQTVQLDGVRLEYAEMGEGPLVILVHGFPELWYSWRHQIPAIAADGYRVVAINQRGYGQSSKFWHVNKYSLAELVADLVKLVAALGETKAILIGHDWGAPVVWTAAWRFPKIFTGVLGMSVPFSGRGQIALPGNPFGEHSPDAIHRIIAGPDLDFYQVYFSQLTGIIDEIEADVRSWLRDLTWTVSGEALAGIGFSLEGADPVEMIRGGALCMERGAKLKDRFLTPEKMPDWFTDDDLDIFVTALQGGGFSGPLSFYHNLQRNWEDLAPMEGRLLESPAMFIGGEYDVATWWGAEAIERAGEYIPNWLGSHVLAGAGHWIQQEKPEETNALVLNFLRQLRSGN